MSATCAEKVTNSARLQKICTWHQTWTWWTSTPYMSSHLTRSRYWYSARAGTWPLS